MWESQSCLVSWRPAGHDNSSGQPYMVLIYKLWFRRDLEVTVLLERWMELEISYRLKTLQKQYLTVHDFHAVTWGANSFCFFEVCTVGGKSLSIGTLHELMHKNTWLRFKTQWIVKQANTLPHVLQVYIYVGLCMRAAVIQATHHFTELIKSPVTLNVVYWKQKAVIDTKSTVCSMYSDVEFQYIFLVSFAACTGSNCNSKAVTGNYGRGYKKGHRL